MVRVAKAEKRRNAFGPNCRIRSTEYDRQLQLRNKFSGVSYFLRQRRNFSKLLCIPHLDQFRLVHLGPLNDHLSDPNRKIALDHFKCTNIKQCDEFTVNRVKMRRRMVAEKELDDNSVESCNLRHEWNFITTLLGKKQSVRIRARTLRGSFRLVSSLQTSDSVKRYPPDVP